MKKLQPKELKKKTDKELEEMLKVLRNALMESYGMFNKEDARKDMATIKKNTARIKTIQNDRTRRRKNE